MIRTGLPLLAFLLALSPAARAQAPASPPALQAAIEAADRGDLGPAERALSAAEGDAAILLRARLAAARFDPAVARDPALARLAKTGEGVLRDAALSILMSASFASGDYRAAEAWGRRLAQAQIARGDAEGAAETEQAWRLAAMLAGSPALAVEGAIGEGSAAARVDRVGLPRIDVAVNGIAQEAVFDTGANLSVLSAESARRLGLRLLDGASNVGNGVQGIVPIRVGIADRLAIAGATLRNVPFLIIDDAQLTFPVPGGYDIKAIVGLPVMRMLGRMRIERAGRFVLPGPAEAGPAAAPNISAGGNDLFVTVAVDGQAVPMHLDTGANKSSLSALYARAHPETVAALARRTAGMASAGGARLASVATWPNAPLALAGRTLLLPSLEIGLPSAGGPAPRFIGVLGSDVLRAFESYTLDLHAMRLELGAPVQAAAPAQ
ncbi:MAG TPA: retropepsin-like aspartic protease [Allosphingosinicella sp.]|jgi:predicted aspartyl protease|nr:retropepsin-like aspartic protease [Allosphingosinicella sp.]